LLKNSICKSILETGKNFRATLFFRTSASCSKMLNNKKYMFNTVKNIRATLFFRASASCSKILNVKSIFHTVKNFWATLFFRASASCSKLLNDKKYIFSTVNSGNLCFSGQAQVAQKSWMIKIHVQNQWKISGQLCFSGQAHGNCSKILNVKVYTILRKFLDNFDFQGKRKLLKTRECITYIQYSEKFQGTLFFRASAGYSKSLNNKSIYSVQ